MKWTEAGLLTNRVPNVSLMYCFIVFRFKIFILCHVFQFKMRYV